MQKAIEVEVKTLLETKESADLFQQKIESLGFEYKDSESQLNHYFSGGLTKKTIDLISPSLSQESIAQLGFVLDADKQSVRTRQIITDDPRDPIVLLIIKVAIEGTSQNGSIRWEVEVPVNASLDRLDGWLIESGLEYQSKWSRDRRVFVRDDTTEDVTAVIDRNAGYGYLAEFEIVAKQEHAAVARDYLKRLLQETGFEELDPARLDRMFAFYSANWGDYYGTDKTFTLE